jgi:hypothetical protein
MSYVTNLGFGGWSRGRGRVRGGDGIVALGVGDAEGDLLVEVEGVVVKKSESGRLNKVG